VSRRVWVVSPFSYPGGPESPDRYGYLCHALRARGAEVTQFVSGFDHHAHKGRRRPPALPWRCVAVAEPGYARNVSARRLASHAVFDLLLPGYFLREVLRGGLPDAVLTALPHNGAALLAGLFCKAFGARFVVDVHDTWPESVLSVTRLNAATRMGYLAWKKCADLAYRLADAAFGESERYAARASEVRVPLGKTPAQAIHLGGDIGYYEGVAPAPALPAELRGAHFVVAYAGTLGANYDLDCAVEAFDAFSAECPDAGLLLLGGGEREAELRARLAELGLPAWVSGRIPHRELVGYLKRAQVGLNCFKAGGNVAYSYKLNDYLLSGLPVVNSLEGEAAEMVSRHGLGANYQAGDAQSLLAALRQCRARWAEEPDWPARLLAFSARVLDRDHTYLPMVAECLAESRP
jgi:glycosyltransferase involved in cell wall biosynthesis